MRCLAKRNLSELEMRKPAATGADQLKARQIIVFGAGEIAEPADFYSTQDSEYEVAGFTIDNAYVAVSCAKLNNVRNSIARNRSTNGRACIMAKARRYA
jgi:hypothetical protein